MAISYTNTQNTIHCNTKRGGRGCALASVNFQLTSTSELQVYTVNRHFVLYAICERDVIMIYLVWVRYIFDCNHFDSIFYHLNNLYRLDILQNYWQDNFRELWCKDIYPLCLKSTYQPFYLSLINISLDVRRAMCDRRRER